VTPGTPGPQLAYQQPNQPVPTYVPVTPAPARSTPESNFNITAILVGILAVVLLGIGLIWALFWAVGNWITIGTAPIGPLTTETQAVQLGNAGAVNANITMGAGNLTLRGGASDLMNATFTYNVPAWKPIIDYSVAVNGGTGSLSVRQPSVNNTGSSRYEWDLRLNNNVPTDLQVHMGAGQSMLNLAGMNLTGLEMSTGAGQATVDLTSIHKSSFNGTITGGAGQVTLIVPSDLGVRVNVRGGLAPVSASGFTKDGNTYTNSAYGTSDAKVNVDVTAGVGQIVLQSK
jgi:hypothetical protein